MVTRQLHPRHCTEAVAIAAYSPDTTGFAGSWSSDPSTWLAQVEGRRELAVTADGVAAHTVLTIRIPPAAAAHDDGPLLYEEEPAGARGLINEVPLQSLVVYRGQLSYVLAVREVLRYGMLVYLEVTTGDQAPLFGGWLVRDVVLERNPGFDRRGNPTPATKVTIPVAVIRSVKSADPAEHQEPETTVELLLPPDAPAVASTDRALVPSSPLAGRYQVDGDPLPSPSRTVVQMRRI